LRFSRLSNLCTVCHHFILAVPKAALLLRKYCACRIWLFVYYEDIGRS
jgi:hypothetical protein